MSSARIDPLRAPGAQVAGGDLAPGRPVRLEQLLHQRDEPLRPRDTADGRRRIDAAQEAQLALPDVPRTGDHALIEERVADRPLRLRGETAQRLARLPRRAQRIGTQVSQDLALA